MCPGSTIKICQKESSEEMGCVIVTANNYCSHLLPSCCRHKLVGCLVKKRNVLHKKLEDQDPCITQNKIVRTKSLKFGGLVGKDDINTSALMFVRSKVVEMWNELDNIQPRKQLQVCGPPGTGKTTVAWAWACYTAQKQNVLWVHVNKFTQRLTICHFFCKCMRSFEVGPDSLKYLIDFLDADYMVIDGVTHADYKDIIGDAQEWMDMGKNRKLAVITSQQHIIPSHEQKISGISTWDMPSWKWDEYASACRHKEFYQQIEEFLPFISDKATEEEKLRAKYYLAGASARWMFSTTFDELPDEIENQLSKVRDKEVLMQGVAGTHYSGAVGHLTMVDSNKRIFLVSRYVARRVAETVQVKSDFLSRARRYAKQYGNPAFEGWVIEFDFLFRVREAEADSRYSGVYVQECLNRDGEDEILKEKEVLPVSKVTLRVDPKDSKQMQNLCVTKGSWFFPKLWNQGV